MTEYGRKGIELLKEILNHDNDSVSAYNEDLVRSIVQEVHDHASTMERISQEHGDQDSQVVGTDVWQEHIDQAAACVIHLHSGIRNKKLLLAYLMQRMERLKTVRWGQRALPEDVATNCSPHELEFYKKYDSLLSWYMGKDEKDGVAGVGLDLTLDVRPPKTNNVLVKVLEDQGDMMFSFGQATLLRGTLHLLPVDEAEPLIREGSVEPVDA
ncbi:hypothetical protein FOA52_002864 [Chlamydomonas sp. UWO 241]|nr:hypothetical protein FOA52_002864 [Chlamydomonas sp. UWO 241]